MARYIDANALYKETEKKIKEANSYRMAVVDSEFLDLINDADEADVVPRAKYEELQHKYELAVAEREANVKGFAEDIAKAKSEVAKKICCEIEEEIIAALESNYRALKEWDNGRNNDYILELVGRIKGKIDALRGIEAFVEELKEKYTKGGEGDV